MTTKKICILYSGGLDSAIMKRFVEKTEPIAEVVCVFFDIGQPYAEKEKAALPDFVEVRKVEWLNHSTGLHGKAGSSSGDIYIPGRNLTLISLAASIYLPDEIWLGALLGETHDTATDKNFKFLEDTTKLLQYVHSAFKPKMKVRFPLAEAGFNKFTATEWAFNNGFSAEQLMHTSSCLSGEAGRCGNCVVCFRRWGIFKQLGFEESYNRNVLSCPENIRVAEEMIYGDYYDEHRKCEVLPALQMEADEREVSLEAFVKSMWQRSVLPFIYAQEDELKYRKKLADACPQSFAQNKAIETVKFNGFPFVVATIEAMEGGTRQVFFGDCVYPGLRDEAYAMLKVGMKSDCGGYEITADGLPEAVLNINTADVDKLTKFKPYTTLDIETVARTMPTVRNLVKANLLRFAEANGIDFDVVDINVIVDREISSWAKYGRSVVGHFIKSNLVSIGVYEIRGKTMYGIAMYRDTSVNGSGSLINVERIKRCKQLNLEKLNLGIAFIDYKHSWSNSVETTVGIKKL